MPEIPATWEAEVGGSRFEAIQGKQIKSKRARGMAQVKKKLLKAY
jgi:hypothetical protein